MFGAINNGINAIYYNYISDGKSDLAPDSYSNGGTRYINRWDRLDYTKHQTKQSKYNKTAMKYFGEYNLHMYGWIAFGWTKDKGWGKFSDKVGHLESADVEVGVQDNRPYINYLSWILVLLGI